MVQSLYIAFAGRSVVVDSESVLVLERIRRRFSALEARPVESAATRFVVVEAKEGGPYAFTSGDTLISCTSPGELVERLTYEISLDMMEARPDLLWLHAASAELGGYAVALAGDSGRGKSTVVTGLCEHGWTYMSDDITPLDPATGLLIPFALAPEVRSYPGVELPVDVVRTLKKAEVALEAGQVQREPVPIGALIFPGYDSRGSARLAPCSAAEAAIELLPCCLNYIRHREAAVRYVCELVQRLPAFRLSFNTKGDAAELLAKVHPRWRSVQAGA